MPSQVEITAGSAAKSKPSFGSGFSFRLDKKAIIIIAAVAVAAVVVVLFLTGVFGSRYADRLDTIEKQMQSVNGAQATNYLPILKDTVKWTEISEGEREGIAKYAVKKALEEAEKEQAGIFNIMGFSVSEGTRAVAFVYTPEGDGKIQVISAGQVTGIVDAK